MSSSRNHKSRKNAKIEEIEEEKMSMTIWTTVEETPPVPAENWGYRSWMVDGVQHQSSFEQDLNENEMNKFRTRLQESLQEAVATGNVLFIRQVLETPQTRDLVAVIAYGSPASHSHWICNMNLVAEAAGCNQLEVLEELVTRLGFDINATYRRGTESSMMYPLLTAIENRHADTIQFLLNQPQIW